MPVPQQYVANLTPDQEIKLHGLLDQIETYAKGAFDQDGKEIAVVMELTITHSIFEFIQDVTEVLASRMLERLGFTITRLPDHDEAD